MRRRVQKVGTCYGLSTREECMQMKTTAGPKRKYNSPSHPGMPPFEVIEIAAAAVSCAASGGLSLERQLDIVRVRQMQDLAKCGMLRRLQQVSIGRNGTSSRRKAPHRGGDNRSPTASKRSLAAPPPSFENRSSPSRENKTSCEHLF